MNHGQNFCLSLKVLQIWHVLNFVKNKFSQTLVYLIIEFFPKIAKAMAFKVQLDLYNVMTYFQFYAQNSDTISQDIKSLQA